MMKRTTIALALSTLCLTAPAALAQHHHGHDGHHGHQTIHAQHIPHAQHVPHAEHAEHAEHATHGVYNGVHLPNHETLKEWGFDDELIEELRDLEKGFEDRSSDLRGELDEASKDLQRLNGDARASESTMHGAIERYFEAKADLLKLQATAAVNARRVMGEERFAKIVDAHRSRVDD